MAAVVGCIRTFISLLVDQAVCMSLVTLAYGLSADVLGSGIALPESLQIGDFQRKSLFTL